MKPSLPHPSGAAAGLVVLSLLAACSGAGEASDAQAPDAPDSAPASASASDAAPNQEAPTQEAPVSDDSVYSLSVNSLAGDSVDLSKYAGKVTLFVNVASKCGYTRQYKDLQQLHESMGGEDFAIVGVPSNDFGGQEPGTAEEIQAFCSDTYGVTFDMLEKVGTKDGDSELFDRLASLTDGSRPGWNFCKYVVSKDGTSAKFFESKASPGGPEIKAAIDELKGS